MITAFGCIVLFIIGIAAIGFSAIYFMLIHGFGSQIREKLYATGILIFGITAIIIAVTHFPHLIISIIW